MKKQKTKGYTYQMNEKVVAFTEPRLPYMKMRQFSFILVAISFLLASSFSLNAQYKYSTEFRKEAKIVLGSGVLLGAAGLINSSRSAVTAEDISALDPLSITKFNRSAIFNNNTTSSKRSDVLKYATLVTPFILFAGKESRNQWTAIAPMYFETLVANYALTSFTKAITQRKRPYLYNPDRPISEKLNDKADKSFYSGHVSHVSSITFFSAQVFTDLYPNSKYKSLVWVTAAAIPAYTAYLRYDGGHHFPTDVIIGYAAGAVVGLLIPRLHRVKLPESIKANLVPSFQGGIVMSIAVKL